MKSSTRSSGSPTEGRITPWTPVGSTFAETALVWSVIRFTCEELRCTAETSPTRPSPLITGSSTTTPSPLPRSIVTDECQTVGERAMTRPVTGSNADVGDHRVAVEFEQLAQLRVLLQRLLAGHRLDPDLRQFVLEAAVFAARFEGLVEPVDEVAGGLQRPVGDPLQRAEDRADAVLDAARAPAVGDRQEQERAEDEEREYRPTAAYLLAIHEGALSPWIAGGS